MGSIDPEDYPRIVLSDLDIEPFIETSKVRGFDSRSKELNDFLNTEEVEEYLHQGLGTTQLVFFKGTLVAYFTTCSDGLIIDMVRDKKTSKSYMKLGEAIVDKIPAVKIGRLAVQRQWEGKGIGKQLIKYIAGMALEMRKSVAVRLLIVESKRESIEFYQKCGFVLTVETKRERKRMNRTMFFDLDTIADVQEPATD